MTPCAWPLDYRVAGLDGETFKFWHGCLSVAINAEMQGKLPVDLQAICFCLRIKDVDTLHKLMDRLIAAELIIEDVKGRWEVANWKAYLPKEIPPATPPEKNGKHTVPDDVEPFHCPP